MKRIFLISFAIFVSTLYGADFTTYIGDENQYQAAALTADSAGNTYVTGSRILQIPNGEQTNDVFVTKLDATGNIVFTTTFGGKGTDQGSAIALDSSGDIWVGGGTSSDNFPLHDALEIFASGQGFLVKLAPDGTVIYSSYFGGVVNGLAVDPGGNVYLTGLTYDRSFPTTSGLPNDTADLCSPCIGQTSGMFATKLDPTGSRIIYSTVIGGIQRDCSGGSSCFTSNIATTGVGIALDSAGDAFVAGNANVTDLPITPGAVAGAGAFAVKINAAGNKIDYLTYIGPPNGDPDLLGPPETITATGIAADGAGNAYLTGFTNDTLFPATPGAYQAKLNADLTQLFPNSNAFALKLNSAGEVAWGTYLGGPTNDAGHAISLDGSGDVWLVGSKSAGAQDTLAELSSDGSKLLYSTIFAGGTAGQSVAVDQAGVLHVAGTVGLVSTISPAQTAASRIFGIMNAAAGTVSGRIAPGEVISIFGFGLGPANAAIATPTNSRFPTTLGGVQVLVNGNAIPLLYVSASQINAQIPAPLNGVENGSTSVQIINGLATLPSFRVEIDQTIFGVFQNADGSIAAINQDGTLNSATNPAKAGTIVSIWGTGFLNPGVNADGAVTTAANNWCSYCQIAVGLVGGVMETVAYAGAAPGLIDGVMQINFMIPKPVDEFMGQTYVYFNGLAVNGFIYVSE